MAIRFPVLDLVTAAGSGAAIQEYPPLPYERQEENKHEFGAACLILKSAPLRSRTSPCHAAATGRCAPSTMHSTTDLDIRVKLNKESAFWTWRWPCQRDALRLRAEAPPVIPAGVRFQADELINQQRVRREMLATGTTAVRRGRDGSSFAETEDSRKGLQLDARTAGSVWSD